MTDDQLSILVKLAKDKKYGRGLNHAYQVNKLALRIYDQLSAAGALESSKDDKMMLKAAALLHDIGLPGQPHNEAGFDILAKTLPVLLVCHPLPDAEFSTLLYCVLWHRESSFTKRGTVAITNPGYTSQMAAIIRVADALDRTLGQLVKDVRIRLDGRLLTVAVFSKHSVDTEIHRAKEKSDLLKEAYGLAEVVCEHKRQ